MSEPEAAARVENLTRHSVNVDMAHGAVATFPPSGAEARVEETVLREERFATTEGEVRTVTLARDTPVLGLPEPLTGVFYLVSRLTAKVSAGRDDLVFPLGGRYEGGRIVSVMAFGRFGRERGPRGWQGIRGRHRGACGWRLRHGDAGKLRHGGASKRALVIGAASLSMAAAIVAVGVRQWAHAVRRSEAPRL